MDIEQLDHLKSDDRLKLKALYNAYRQSFLNFGKTYGLDEAALCDVYQEAFLSLRKRAVQGKLDRLTGSLKSYLFGIGKHMIFDTLKKRQRTVPMENPLQVIKEDRVTEIPLEKPMVLTEQQQRLRTFFKKLGKKCQLVLTLFYYRGLTIEEIVEHTDYGNANTVKAQKSRCLKTLKEFLN